MSITIEEYNKLKSEFEEHKTLSDEYIQELENALEVVNKSKSSLDSENRQLKQDIDKTKEKLTEKNKEINQLEQQIDKIKSNQSAFDSNKQILEQKLIQLENDNSDLSDKVRDLECYCDELRNKLNAALEENIILQSEIESSRDYYEEQLQRIKQELEDCKSEILSKEKAINRITIHRDFLLKTCGNDYNESNSRLNPSHSVSILQSNKILETFSNSFIKKTSSNNNENNNNDNHDDIDYDSDEKDFIKDKINSEIKHIIENRKNFVLNTLAIENISFDINNKNVFVNQIQKTKLLEGIEDILSKISTRKEKILSKKKYLMNKINNNNNFVKV